MKSTTSNAFVRNLLETTLARDAYDDVRGKLERGEPLSRSDAHVILSRMEALETLVTIDPLTGLLNRRGFDNSLEEAQDHACLPAYHGDIWLLYADLDRFKQVNDHLGHEIGDKILKATATYLEQHFKLGDRIGRLGGDEFGILLQGPLGNDVTFTRRFESLRVGYVHAMGVAVPELCDLSEMPLDLSVGVARYARDRDYRTVVAEADRAMYEAKRSGRGVVFSALN